MDDDRFSLQSLYQGFNVENDRRNIKLEEELPLTNVMYKDQDG